MAHLFDSASIFQYINIAFFGKQRFQSPWERIFLFSPTKRQPMTFQ